MSFRVEVLDPTARSESWVGNAVRYDFLGEAWEAGGDLLRRWLSPEAFRVMQDGNDVPQAVSTCGECQRYIGQMYPSHAGSTGCESGSLASGGNRSHCSCDACF